MNGSVVAQTSALSPEIAGITKRYGDQLALADVSFDVHSGEVLGVIGPNGAGKTTLLESIAGVLPVDSGAVSWRGFPVRQPDRRKFIFYLPDQMRPWPDQYVSRVLQFFAGVYHRSSSDVAAAVESVGLAPVLRKRVFALSKGYARRLIWAIGMLAPQPLLLMDEPFDGFDLRQTREMIGTLRSIVRGGRAVIVSIHQLLDAERICDRFVLLAEGRVRGFGSLEDLRAQARCAGGLEEIFLALT